MIDIKSQIAPKGLHFNPSDFFISDKYATILTITSVLSLALFFKLSGKQEISF